MRVLLMCVMLLGFAGCETTWQWPIEYPRHLDLTMTGLTISWPLILIAFAVLVVVLWIKAKIRSARKRDD